MNLAAKLVVWSQVVTLAALGGLGLGVACDGLLWEWSYDYVFPVGYCRSNGVKLGFLLGTIIAAASVLGMRPLPRWQITLAQGIGFILLCCLMALLTGTVSWALAKWGVNPAGDGFHPLSRMAFCSSLVNGAYYGGWISAILWSGFTWRSRSFASTANSQTAASGLHPQGLHESRGNPPPSVIRS